APIAELRVESPEFGTPTNGVDRRCRRGEVRSEGSHFYPEVSMSLSAPARGRRGRRAPEGPRASFRQLLPFLAEHTRTLVVVGVLSI
ncbi:hypothetical protein ACO1LH_13840, partial [Staphylococcus aureus]